MAKRRRGLLRRLKRRIGKRLERKRRRRLHRIEVKHPIVKKALIKLHRPTAVEIAEKSEKRRRKRLKRYGFAF